MWRRDEGNTHVLEAVIVASIMVTSVAYVVSIDAPVAHGEEQRGALEQRLVDALAILNDTPVTSTLGTNLLEVALQECLQNDCERLSTHLDKLMPSGAQYAVYLSTRDGLLPVYAPREPQGEAVTARRLIEPAWSYHFLALSQSLYDPLQDPVVVYGLPVYSGDLLQQGGSGLRITVHGNRTDNARYVMQSSATTRAGGAAAASLFFHAGDGVPLAARDVRATTLVPVLGTPTLTPVPFQLRVQESGGGIVPAGTLLEVQLPRGWTASAKADGKNTANWTFVSNATNKSGASVGSSIVAKLKRDVSASHVDLAFDASYHGDTNDHYPFQASLSGGAYAQAQTLVRGDRHLVRPLYEVPTVLASVPRPMGAGSATTWTLTAFSSDAITATRIEVVEEEGRDIFAAVSPLAGPGTWTREEGKLVWRGSVALSHDTPLALSFRVTSSADGPATSERAPYSPAVSLGKFAGRLTQQTSPGLYRGVFPPATAVYGGYDASVAGLRQEHALASASIYRTTALPGSTTYQVGHVVGLKDSLFGSAVSAQERRVEPGGTATLDVEVQSVMYELALAGLTPSIDLHVYPPWSGDDREPIASREVYNGTLARGGGTPLSLIDTNGDLLPDLGSNVGRHEVQLPVPENWLYGPYAVETRISWFETLSQGPGPTENLVRTASVYDYFLVKPRQAELPASPIYDVHLVGWLEEWY